MVRSIRVKELVYPGDFSGTGTFDATTTETVFSNHPINGEILEVDWTFNRAGSMFLSFSGTGEEFWRRNAPSGASTNITRPYVFTEEVATGSIANAQHVPFVANDVIAFDVGSALSGTQALTFTIRYR